LTHINFANLQSVIAANQSVTTIEVQSSIASEVQSVTAIEVQSVIASEAKQSIRGFNFEVSVDCFGKNRLAMTGFFSTTHSGENQNFYSAKVTCIGLQNSFTDA